MPASCSASWRVSTTVVWVLPLSVSHTCPAPPLPCRVMIRVVGAPSSIWVRTIARNVSSVVGVCASGVSFMVGKATAVSATPEVVREVRYGAVPPADVDHGNGG